MSTITIRGRHVEYRGAYLQEVNCSARDQPLPHPQRMFWALDDADLWVADHIARHQSSRMGEQMHVIHEPATESETP